jgi:uncharacterized protein (DUF4213/DUF364 family)
MSIYESFAKMISRLNAVYDIPNIHSVFFPPFYPGGQPKESEFMAVMLESKTVGISYVMLPDTRMADYNRLSSADFEGRSPVDLALKFGSDDEIENMMGLASLNAICQQIILSSCYSMDISTDSLGLIDVEKGDRVGMVGFFYPLVKRVEQKGAELVIIEKDPKYVEKYPQYKVTIDPSFLLDCNKVLCTSTTVFNNTIDDIISNCSPDAFISIIGPTAGYFPDPLFEKGVNVVGGTMVKDGELFMKLIAEKERWGPATQKFCFRRDNYAGLPV